MKQSYVYFLIYQIFLFIFFDIYKKSININKMAKILITENQLQNIKNQLVNEDIDKRYERKVSVDVDSYNVKINGVGIDFASCSDINLTYLIEQEHKSWGIKDISLYDIKGPSEIEISITPEEDGEDVQLTLPLNWDDVERENEEGQGVITVGNEITIKLGNNENGEVVVDSIHVPVYTL